MTLSTFIYLLNVFFWGMAAGLYLVAFRPVLKRVDFWTKQRTLNHGLMIAYLCYSYAEAFSYDVEIGKRHYVGLVLGFVVMCTHGMSLYQSVMGKTLTLHKALEHRHDKDETEQAH